MFFNGIFKGFALYSKCGSLRVKNDTMEIDIWNKPLGLSSWNNKQKLSLIEKNQLNLTPRVRSIIIGIILSDGWIQKVGHWNPRVAIKQSVINFPYLWLVTNELSYLCAGLLYSSKNVLRGKLHYSLTLQTRQLSCLNEIVHLMYVKRVGCKNGWVKTIKPDLFFYFNYISLAHLIQGDGSSRNKGVCIITYGYTLPEVVILLNIMIIKFNINPTIYSYETKWDSKIYKNRVSNERLIQHQIQINKVDLDKIRDKILPYFSPHFLYKIYPRL